MEGNVEIDEIDWLRAKEVIDAATNVLLVTHIHPDADAIGSLLGLGAALNAIGKNVIMAVDGGTPPEFSFLQGAELVYSTLPDSAAVDLVIALDGDDLNVLGECGRLAFDRLIPKLIIDHHAFNEFYGTIHLVNVHYASTTEAIVKLLFYLNYDIQAAVADALLLGILSDTQLFKVGPVSIRTFSVVQQLIEAGANYSHLVERIFSTLETGYLKLLGVILSRAVLEDNVYWTWVEPDDFARHNLKQTGRFYVVDDLIQDENAFMAVTFQMVRPEMIRVSMRAVAGLNVGHIADLLGGGGHARAAGCTLNVENVEAAMKITLPLMKEAVKRRDTQLISKDNDSL